MIAQHYTRDVLALYWGSSCRACYCGNNDNSGCSQRYPPYPYVCSQENTASGFKKICKVNIPRVKSESMYASSLAARNTRGGPANRPIARFSMVNWNQSSDRAVPGVQKVHVSRQRTRHRPGGNGQVGFGVDVKHDSYQRYLNRKKGNLKIQLFANNPEYYNKGCPCSEDDPRFSNRAYGQKLQ